MVIFCSYISLPEGRVGHYSHRFLGFFFWSLRQSRNQKSIEIPDLAGKPSITGNCHLPNTHAILKFSQGYDWDFTVLDPASSNIPSYSAYEALAIAPTLTSTFRQLPSWSQALNVCVCVELVIGPQAADAIDLPQIFGPSRVVPLVHHELWGGRFWNH